MCGWRSGAGLCSLSDKALERYRYRYRDILYLYLFSPLAIYFSRVLLFITHITPLCIDIQLGLTPFASLQAWAGLSSAVDTASHHSSLPPLTDIHGGTERDPVALESELKKSMQYLKLGGIEELERILPLNILHSDPDNSPKNPLDNPLFHNHSPNDPSNPADPSTSHERPSRSQQRWEEEMLNIRFYHSFQEFKCIRDELNFQKKSVALITLRVLIALIALITLITLITLVSC